jgi:hypothetical protein
MALSMASVTNMVARVTHVEAGAMKTDDEWVNFVKGTIRVEMTRRQMTYDDLAERLAGLGVKDTPVNLRNKIARGGFSAVFFVQCLKAIGVQDVRL